MSDNDIYLDRVPLTANTSIWMDERDHITIWRDGKCILIIRRPFLKAVLEKADKIALDNTDEGAMNENHFHLHP